MLLHQGSYPCSVEVRIVLILITDILLIVRLILLQHKGSTKRNIPMLCQSPAPPPPPHLHPHCSLGNVADSGLWKHPLMLYTKEALREPLTTLPSIDLQRKAAELFKVNLSSWQLKERKNSPGLCTAACLPEKDPFCRLNGDVDDCTLLDTSRSIFFALKL